VLSNSASLSQAIITNIPGSTSQDFTGSVNFWNDATADAGTIVNQGATATGINGAATYFTDTSTAGSATLIAQAGSNGGGGGFIFFLEGSDGAEGGAEVYGNGALDIGLHDLPGITIGSVIGDGSVLLGGNNLTIGSSNASTSFDGVIQDGGENGGTGGALTKIGTGKLTLTNANTYTGGTTVNGGTLLVNNTTGSGLGTGPVQALSGILGGSGTVSGRVTVGTGRGIGATLGPGANSIIPGTLTIGKQLALKSDATYRVTLNSNTPAADQVVSNGVRILGAQIVFNEVNNTALPLGTAFTVISNTSRKPISGTFTNLPDGGSITIGNNTYKANYEGGDGNDLILTVVP
jgi:autotransporter-associated beta strand protein